MIQSLIHTLRMFFTDPTTLYLNEATDLPDLERRMKRVQTKSFRRF